MKRVVLGVAAVVFLATGQAFAEGMAPPSRIKAPGPVGPSWTGFSVGVGAGVGVLSQELSGTQELSKTSTRDATREATRTLTRQKTKTICNPMHHCGCQPIKVPYTETYTETYTEHYTEEFTEHYTENFRDRQTGDAGVFGTVTVGYDRRLGSRWVGGVFADYDFGSSISVDVSYPGYAGSMDHRGSWSVGARLGFLVTESTLLYGTAGYTQADFDIGSLGSTTFAGYFVGAGVETFLRDNWTLKLEYRYSQFGSETIVDQANMTVDLEPSMHSARLVLSYKLGGHD